MVFSIKDKEKLAEFLAEKEQEKFAKESERKALLEEESKKKINKIFEELDKVLKRQGE